MMQLKMLLQQHASPHQPHVLYAMQIYPAAFHKGALSASPVLHALGNYAQQPLVTDFTCHKVPAVFICSSALRALQIWSGS